MCLDRYPSEMAVDMGNAENEEIWNGVWNPNKAMCDVERFTILAALKHCNGNRMHTARLLGLSLGTIKNKIRLYRKMGTEIPDNPLWKK